MQANPPFTPTQAPLKKKKLKKYTLQEMISLALNHSYQQRLDNAPQQLKDLKQQLDNLDIMQQRVANAVREKEGKKPLPLKIKSENHEAAASWNMINLAINEIAVLQQANPQQQLNLRMKLIKQAIIADTTQAYWKVAAARKTAPELNRLLLKTRELIERGKPTHFSYLDKPFLTEPQKIRLQNLLALLEQIQQDGQNSINNLSSLSGIQPNKVWVKTPTVKTLGIPVPKTETDELITKAVAIFPAAPALQTADISKYLNQQSAGLSYETGFNKQIQPWLSAAKYQAFELLMKIDQLEKQKYLKQKKAEDENEPLLFAASATSRAYISDHLYQLNASRFEQAYCLKQNNQQLLKLKEVDLDDSVAGRLAALETRAGQLQNTKQLFDYYANTQSWFYRLQQSAKTERTTRGTNSFACFTSVAERSNQTRRIQTLEQEKQQALAEVEKLKAEIQALKNPPKKKAAKPVNANTWLIKQNPRHFTLQLISSGNLKQVQNFRNRHQLGKQAKIISTRYKGKPIYVLLYGVFKDRELAYINQFKLPESVFAGRQIWIRRFASLQQKLK